VQEQLHNAAAAVPADAVGAVCSTCCVLLHITGKRVGRIPLILNLGPPPDGGQLHGSASVSIKQEAGWISEPFHKWWPNGDTCSCRISSCGPAHYAEVATLDTAYSYPLA